ncbi:MAG: serine/threonine protein kinase [Planctomycetes bacterium]|nr:serine/threonine protein kinase [Planctomycetota bacterium]
MAHESPTGDTPENRRLQRALDVTESAESHQTETQTFQESLATAGIPERIGPFKIIRKIGQGGMGTVYEAEQESPRRTVALKVIRAGLASSQLLKRFELESQVLGRLQHPGIGQIYQAGTADTESGKRPYFAMEYVRGVDLRRHIKQKNPNTRQRLELLGMICDAVHHAHQKGVIHRDLKPGNILVDQSGQPKILDFGVARATDSDMQITTMQTDVGQLIGTLQYMSPEQVAADPNDLDTRSDVYALGVIAYEMLTGHAPYDLKNKMIHEVARIIQEDEPTSLSSTNKTFRGDIETIVVKALEKDKERRYQSAAGLAEDIRRYLQDEPILARRQSAVYQLQKFAKRHKAVAGGLGIAIAALVVGMATSTYLYIQAESARQGEQEQRIFAQKREADAVAAREESDQVVQFLTDTLGAADPEKSGKDVTVREVMDQAANRVGTAFLTKPLIEARLRHTIGWTYRGLGMLEAANQHLTTASEIRRRELGQDHPDTLVAMMNLASTVLNQGHIAEAERLHRAVLEIQRRVLGEEHLNTLASMQNLANAIRLQGRHAEAETLYRKTLEIEHRVLGLEHPQSLTAMQNLGNALFRKGQYAEAETVFRQTMEIQRRVLGKEHPNSVGTMMNLAGAVYAQGRYAVAERQYRRTLEIQHRVLGDEHFGTLMSMNNLGEVLYSLGNYAEAAALHRKTLEINRRVLGEEHLHTSTSTVNLANALAGQGQYENAETLLRQGLEIMRRVLGAEHPSTMKTMHYLAGVLLRKGQPADAEVLYRRVLETLRRVLGTEHPDTLDSACGLAEALVALGEQDEAVQVYRETIEMGRRKLGRAHPSIGTWLVGLGAALVAEGHASEAKQVIDEGLAIQRPSLPEDHVLLAASRSVLCECLVDLSQHAEAERLLLESYARMTEVQGDSGYNARNALKRIVKLYESWHAGEPGKGYDAKAEEWRAKLPQATDTDDP